MNNTKERNERWLGMSEAQLVMECQDLCQQRDELLAALGHFVTWAKGQHRAQSKGCHATFDMMILRDEIDFAESAIKSVKGGAA